MATAAVTGGMVEGQLRPSGGIMTTLAVGNIGRLMRSGVTLTASQTGRMIVQVLPAAADRMAVTAGAAVMVGGSTVAVGAAAGGMVESQLRPGAGTVTALAVGGSRVFGFMALAAYGPRRMVADIFPAIDRMAVDAGAGVMVGGRRVAAGAVRAPVVERQLGPSDGSVTLLTVGGRSVVALFMTLLAGLSRQSGKT